MTSMSFISVSGTHREAGRQVGEATAEVVRRWAEMPFDTAMVDRYRVATAAHLPWAVEELDGVAEGAGVDPLAVFAGAVAELDMGCTDLVVMPEQTVAGHLLVAHNNDYLAECEGEYVAIEWIVTGDPVCFTIGLGPWPAVGWNDAGLSVTATNLEPADSRVGIPRVLQLRDVVRQRTFADAVEAALHPARASSYNWVLAHGDGSAANIEGGARRAEITYLTDGALAHTNHYVHPALLALQRDGSGLSGSKTRLRRAEDRLGRDAPFTPERLRGLLSDHANAPDSLCRHGNDHAVRTVFWCVADVTDGCVVYGSGPPCRSRSLTHDLHEPGRSAVVRALLTQPEPGGPL